AGVCRAPRARLPNEEPSPAAARPVAGLGVADRPRPALDRRPARGAARRARRLAGALLDRPRHPPGGHRPLLDLADLPWPALAGVRPADPPRAGAPTTGC